MGINAGADVELYSSVSAPFAPSYRLKVQFSSVIYGEHGENNTIICFFNFSIKSQFSFISNNIWRRTKKNDVQIFFFFSIIWRKGGHLPLKKAGFPATIYGDYHYTAGLSYKNLFYLETKKVSNRIRHDLTPY